MGEAEGVDDVGEEAARCQTDREESVKGFRGFVTFASILSLCFDICKELRTRDRGFACKVNSKQCFSACCFDSRSFYAYDAEI